MRKFCLRAKLWTQLESDEPRGCECCYNYCGFWHADLFFFLFLTQMNNFWTARGDSSAHSLTWQAQKGQWTTTRRNAREWARLKSWRSDAHKDTEILWQSFTPPNRKKIGYVLSLLCILLPWGLFCPKSAPCILDFFKYHSSCFLTNPSLSPLHRSYKKLRKMQRHLMGENEWLKQ